MEDVKKISIYLQNETIEKIKKIVMYENLRNELLSDNLPTDYEISDFITGCVNHQLDELDNFFEISGLDDLGKPFRLKNHFKELLDRRGWRQKDLAEITKIQPSSISNILANETQPSLDYFIRIWIAFGCLPFQEVLYREE